MDFNDTPQEAEFRAEVREWLEANAKDYEVGPTRHGDPSDLDEALKRGKEWQAKKADAGYAFLQWPKEYGGRGGTTIEAVIYSVEEANYSLPSEFFVIAPFAGPTMMAYASEEQKKRYIPKMLRGEEVWCQLFSEPSAGSDLAGLRTRAVRDGDDWVISGQKVWTSCAHYADYAIIVTRHDPSLQKHKGLTYFFFDMKSPGVEVVPIKQVSGASNFNEVYLRDVRVPDAQRLGEVGEGWRVALTTLMNERFSVGGRSGLDVDELLELAQNLELEDGPAIKNATVREKMADWYVQSQGIKLTHFRTMTALSKGQTPGPEASIGKLVSASKLQDISSFGMDLMDMGGIVDQDAASAFQQSFLGSPGGRIAGGTDEIMRNIIAERVLGLPGDIRVDKDVPFNKLPTGAV